MPQAPLFPIIFSGPIILSFYPTCFCKHLNFVTFVVTLILPLGTLKDINTGGLPKKSIQPEVNSYVPKGLGELQEEEVLVGSVAAMSPEAWF